MVNALFTHVNKIKKYHTTDKGQLSQAHWISLARAIVIQSSPPPQYSDCHTSTKQRRLSPDRAVELIQHRMGGIALSPMRSKPLSLTGRDVPSSDGRDIERSGTERDPGVDPEMIDVPGSPQPPTNHASQTNSRSHTEMDRLATNQATQGDPETDTEIDSPPLPRTLEPRNDSPRPAGAKRPPAACVSCRDAKRVRVEQVGCKRGTAVAPGRR
ncbi:hypothetical protein HOY80DRAFT_1054159 [Tuber brumale]|nr:hypothetical protein HOY80DRAFT_1054159 [Tuber brumale]